jgi:hypothetical protein
MCPENIVFTAFSFRYLNFVHPEFIRSTERPMVASPIYLCVCELIRTPPPFCITVLPAAELASAVECARERLTRHEFDCGLIRHNSRLDVGS